MSDEASDGDLLTRLPSDPAALETLYRRHIDAVVRYAGRRCTQPADVADLVAATFAAVLESAGSYAPARGDGLPWILDIARRLHANSARPGRRERRASARIQGRHLLGDDDIARLDARIDAAREGPAVERAMLRLPPRHREILWLVGYDGLSPEGAAVALGVAPRPRRMRLTRARRALRRALAPEVTHPPTAAIPIPEVSP